MRITTRRVTFTVRHSFSSARSTHASPVRREVICLRGQGQLSKVCTTTSSAFICCSIQFHSVLFFFRWGREQLHYQMEIALVLMEVPYGSTDLRLFAKRALQVSCFILFCSSQPVRGVPMFTILKSSRCWFVFVGINCLKTNIFNEEFQPVTSLFLSLAKIVIFCC